ncbi:MAG TPA: hypothetical protein VFG81_18645 [Anaerolineales bacterium]|jgi:hypothetical protein|nr:hypothetical protein [Anaerolineales bacterium]
MPDPQEAKLDSLQRQLEFLEMLQRRHVQWASATDNIDIKSKHLNIADALRNVTDEYEEILAAYGKGTI